MPMYACASRRATEIRRGVVTGLEIKIGTGTGKGTGTLSAMSGTGGGIVSGIAKGTQTGALCWLHFSLQC